MQSDSHVVTGDGRSPLSKTSSGESPAKKAGSSLGLKAIKTVATLSVRQIMEGQGIAVGEEHEGNH